MPVWANVVLVVLALLAIGLGILINRYDKK